MAYYAPENAPKWAQELMAAMKETDAIPRHTTLNETMPGGRTEGCFSPPNTPSMQPLLDAIHTAQEEGRDHLTADEWLAAIAHDPELVMQLLDRLAEDGHPSVQPIHDESKAH